ncbi:MAG: PQQ-binding-like beta-propeller repeat protein [Phycisphaerae bacterium]|nr:PQQ-binding-like beta-propeller repeat protein [Phycisphaerae bacterium]
MRIQSVRIPSATIVCLMSASLALAQATVQATRATTRVAQTAPAKKPVPARTTTLQGVVFEDLNANGARDAGEPALEGMSVSNGLEFVVTPASGEFKFVLKERITGSVFVCTPSGWRASKRFYVQADFERFAAKTQSADIGLVRDPARLTDKFSFVQLTDTHVTDDPTTIKTMNEDIDTVNRLSDRPIFVVTTGDLTNRGTKPEEFKGFVVGIENARLPVYNTIGNHDYGGQSRETQNYEKALGPRYYSFSSGPYHFISKDIIAADRDKAGYQRQQAWIEADIKLNAANKRILVFQHYVPTNPELEWWARYQTAGIFSGHWHGRREQLYKGILDVNSATLRFGGIDRSPRGFRVIHVDGDRLRCEWRVGEQNKRVEILNPPKDGEAHGRVPIRVLAYDTAVRVNGVEYRILEGNAADTKPIAEGRLAAEGAWSWAGECPALARAVAGPKKIQVEVTAADGTTWKDESPFTLGTGEPAKPTMGEAWPFFHNDAGHRGYLKTGPQPPLSLAWATNIGGSIHIAGPVVADNRVYAATSFHDSLDDCAVVGLDLVTGKRLWRAPVDSSVKHSPSVWDENVLAVSQAGTLYCFDLQGQTRWTAPLANVKNQRWEVSFPVTDGKTVYAGRSEGFGAFELATGKPLWDQKGGKDWWPNLYTGPSLGSGVVYQGGPFVRALDPATGRIIWNLEKTSVSTVAVVPAVVERDQAGDRLYVFHNGKTLCCLDGSSGKTLWTASCEAPDAKGAGIKSQAVPLGDETGTPAVGDKMICLGGAEVAFPGESRPTAAMHGFDKATGKLIWRFPVGRDLASSLPYKRITSTISSSPIIVGETVYFGASDGFVYGLDVNSGKLLWRHRLGVPIASTAAATGNTLIVTTWDGTVYAMTAGG